jgi:GST-like protein
MYTLHARAGWGSAIVEAQLAWYGLPFAIAEVDDLFESAAARAALSKINPVHQIPTLLLPGGEMLTESAAITLHLADVTGSAELVPAPTEARRAAFLRWLVFLVANVYPTFTYSDDPARFVHVGAAQQPFRAALDAYRERLWLMVEAAAAAPWFLGERFSAIDLYLGVMTRWRPKRPWFDAHCLKLAASTRRVDAEARLAAVWRRNFPA